MRKQLVFSGLLVSTLTAVAAAQTNYQNTFLTSNLSVPGVQLDPNLVDAWGLNFGTAGPAWLTDNGTGLSTLYGSTGVPNSKVVIVPPPASAPTASSTPTGIVANTLTGFNVTNGTTTAKSSFIFCTEDGTISDWGNSVDPTHAFRVVDQSGQNAVFKGLWTGTVTSGPAAGNYLYVANFRSGSVETFNSSFGAATGFSFTDPKLPAGYAPFNIRTIGSSVYVTYAEQDPFSGDHDEVDGKGLGLVDVYDTSGNFVKRLATGGTLNAPWGLALAPANFGQFSGDLLVGNFGDGTINAFDPSSGSFQGQLMASPGVPLVADGLWGLDFGNGGSGFATNTLYYAAGPDGEANGAFGSITVVPEPASVALLCVVPFLLGRRSARRGA